jgi:hypothetical protein
MYVDDASPHRRTHPLDPIPRSATSPPPPRAAPGRPAGLLSEPPRRAAAALDAAGTDATSVRFIRPSWPCGRSPHSVRIRSARVSVHPLRQGFCVPASSSARGPCPHFQGTPQSEELSKILGTAQVWIDEEWTPPANRRAKLPAEAATTSPHAGHAIQDAVLLVMPEPAPRHIVAPPDARVNREEGQPDPRIAVSHGHGVIIVRIAHLAATSRYTPRARSTHDSAPGGRHVSAAHFIAGCLSGRT